MVVPFFCLIKCTQGVPIFDLEEKMNREERILEFDKIKQIWMELAFTQKAKQKIEDMVPYLSEIELTAALRETTESCALLEKCGNPPIVSLNGMEEIIAIASRGECLAPSQLEQVKTVLVLR